MIRYKAAVLSVFLFTAISFAADRPSPPPFTIGFTTRPPSMEIGRDKGVWNNVKPVLLNKSANGHASPVPSTKVKAVCDTTYVYFWFENRDDHISTNPHPCIDLITPVSGLIWPKRDLEAIYLLGTTGSLTAGPAYANRFVFSADGAVQVDRFTYPSGSNFPHLPAERRPNKEVTVVVGPLSGPSAGWVAEVRIPLSSLGFRPGSRTANGGGVGVQLLRLDRPDGLIDCNPDGYNKRSNAAMAWPCGKLTDEWRRDRFGSIVFAGPTHRAPARQKPNGKRSR